ncbi:hypothetical protein C9374_007129 [Naegleria lovaniensis]|uniref:DDB1- and CUL4-associated factor 13 n=1 Tax=Naegleria lovaniensis TaxID=51637 RepID=A0AA88H2Z9_NAELO|nr:uncharacterized protein C9374_013807 [Naegleria lovaniensis]XP_044555492.1 uncharacterized protein C9374_007129 [Naegleria lovaniensis]KAG2370851.1 hypothetical protein C9374_013807 [Naegleria lovaniensis]KAG2393598.1 hypothetical protein C9374_007129 [Naegleria lovaniensis]
MVKITTISRDDDAHTRRTSYETTRHFSDPNPELIHRFEKPREYMRAINAAKIDNIYAKPFLADLSGHADTPTCICTDPNSLIHIISGSCDGQIRVWDLTERKTIYAIDRAHNGFVNGIVIPPYRHSSDSSENSFYFTVGTDKHLKRWELNLQVANVNPNMASTKFGSIGYTLADYVGKSNSNATTKLPSYATPIQDVVSHNALLCIDHHYSDPIVVTSGHEYVQIWDCSGNSSSSLIPGNSSRLVCKQEYELATSTETIYSVKFNKVEKNLIAYCARDRTVGLYDMKTNQMIRAVTMQTKSNKVCWSPMNPFHFSAANEDGNVYTFDMRILEKGPLMMHSGHINAVMDVDYNPSGTEIVTAGYDKTIRIFRTDSTSYKAREVYHTKRMQRVFCVKYSGDGRYIYSGSDDQAIRIWKDERSAPLRGGGMTKKEQQQIEYNQKLIERYRSVEEVRKIANHRHLPHRVKTQSKEMQKEREAEDRREKIRERFTKKKDTNKNSLTAKIEKVKAMRKRFLKVNE